MSKVLRVISLGYASLLKTINSPKGLMLLVN